MALVLQASKWIEEDQVPLKNFALIRKYLEGTTPDTAAVAAELTAPINDMLTNNLLPNSAVRTAEHHLWLLWDLFIVLVKQIPHSHPWQAKLVELLAAIKKVPAPSSPDRESFEREYGFRLWVDLPIFGADIRETWNQGPWEKSLEARQFIDQHWWMRPFSVDVWVRLNAFIARVTVASVLNFESFAIWLLHHALEEPRRADGLDDTLPAAATWILHAGNIIYHNGAYGGIEPKKPDPARSQDLYKGPDGFCRERWDFWKGWFGCARDNSQLKEKTRTFAKDAYDVMEQIETIEPEPSRDPNRPVLPAAGQMRAVYVADMS